jgi:hypothetical protein
MAALLDVFAAAFGARVLLRLRRWMCVGEDAWRLIAA